METLYIFRTNLKNLEYYHEYNDLKTFKDNCHDFYLLQGIYFLENNYFDRVVIWRLSDKPINDIKFIVNGKEFIQRWVHNFKVVFSYLPADVTLFRGGFKEYDEITKKDPKFFGLKLYLAAGKRLTPQYNGLYNKILIEDERDKLDDNFIPFYKTTNPNIFKPLNLDKKYDLCIISNFTQLGYKGTDLIFNEISKNKFLKKLKICHVGNKSEIGINLCKKQNVNNIEFLGHKSRLEVNKILNESKFGIVNSNRTDGCPRVITEILTSGTPLFINYTTRVLSYYKRYGVVEFIDQNFTKKIIEGFNNYDKIKMDLINNLDMFDMNKICEMNNKNWRL
jgi:hypothetical protein